MSVWTPIPDINVEFDAIAFRHHMARIIAITGTDARKVVREEARGLLKHVIMFTPPFGEAVKNPTTGRMRKPHGKTVGRAAVDRDVRRALNPMIEEEWNNPRIKTIIRNRDGKAMAAILDNMKWTKSKGMTEASGGDFRSQHLAVRDNYGRVRKRSNTFTFDGAGALAYLRKVQKRVGMAKGSWGKALMMTGGTPDPWTMKALTHSSKTIHKEINDLNDPTRPSIEVTSYARGVKGNDRLKHAIVGAMRARSIAMQTKLKRLITNPGKTNYYK